VSTPSSQYPSLDHADRLLTLYRLTIRPSMYSFSFRCIVMIAIIIIRSTGVERKRRCLVYRMKARPFHVQVVRSHNQISARIDPTPEHKVTRHSPIVS
jgi:hypothetical protein